MRLEGFSDSINYRTGELRRLLKRYGQPEIIDGEAGAALWRTVRDAAPLAEPRPRPPCGGSPPRRPAGRPWRRRSRPSATRAGSSTGAAA